MKKSKVDELWDNIEYMSFIQESIEHMRQLVRRMNWKKHYAANPLMENVIPGIYKDYIWTLNVPYIEMITHAVMQAALHSEEKLQMDFGGWFPESNQSELYQVKKGDMKEISQSGDYHVDYDEYLVLTGFSADVKEWELVYGTLNPGSSKFGPISVYYKNKIRLLNAPVIIEPRSAVQFESFVLRDGDYVPLGGLETLRGYWISTRSRALERRGKR